MTKQPTNRRNFLGSSTALTATATLAATTWTAKSYGRIIGANDRLGVGLIGGGVIGNAHMGVINNLRKRTTSFPLPSPIAG